MVMIFGKVIYTIMALSPQDTHTYICVTFLQKSSYTEKNWRMGMGLLYNINIYIFLFPIIHTIVTIMFWLRKTTNIIINNRYILYQIYIHIYIYIIYLHLHFPVTVTLNGVLFVPPMKGLSMCQQDIMLVHMTSTVPLLQSVLILLQLKQFKWDYWKNILLENLVKNNWNGAKRTSLWPSPGPCIGIV